MASFDGYSGGGDDLDSSTGRPFDSDGYMGYDPRLPSQRFESFDMPESFPDDQFPPSDEAKDLYEDYKGTNGFDHDEPPPPFESAFDDDLGGGQSPALSSSFGQSFESSHQPGFAPADEFSHSVDSNGKAFGHDEVDELYGFPQSAGNGPVLPPLEEMQPEEGYLLREWKLKNAILLEEKARDEREKLSRIIDSADSFKDEFYEKRKLHCETTKKNNREKEKAFLEDREKFHSTADKHYWKAIAELVPHELPSMEVKSRSGKDNKKKPSVVINRGPKPGKATDLTRMRQVLLKLKHNPPAHMKAPPAPPVAAPGAEASDATPASSEAPPPPQRQGSIQAVAGA